MSEVPCRGWVLRLEGMAMRKKLWLVGTLSAAMAFSGIGCTVHTGVRTRTPNLVWVDPGVWVVADYRYP
ncbi:MAG: hypothetical protein ACODAG_08710, partial [Myxococcota bacterium]